MRNKNLKRITCAALAVIMLLTLAMGLIGCNKAETGNGETTASTTAATDATTDTTVGNAEDATDPTATVDATGDATEATGETTDATTDTTAATEAGSNGHVHNYVKEIIPPLCEVAGYDLYQCECGASYKDGYYKPAGHGIIDEVIKPTATEQGYTVHFCAYCDYEYNDSYVPATGSNSGSEGGSTTNSNTGMPSEKEVAAAVIKYINQLRAAEGSGGATAVPGLTRIAEERASQLIYDFRHDDRALKDLCEKYEYGTFIDATEFGADASKSYYTFGGAEAIGQGTTSRDADRMGRMIAEGFKNSAGHWRYVGDGANAYIGVGITYSSTYDTWYCCINLSKENYG